MSRGKGALTKTEKIVIQLIAKGLSNEEAAAEMFVSAAAVRQHLYSIFKKEGFTRRYDLIKKYHGVELSIEPRHVRKTPKQVPKPRLAEIDRSILPKGINPIGSDD